MTTAFRRSKKYESLNHNNNTKCKGRILVDNLKHFTHLRLHVYNTSLLPTNRNYVTYGLENYERRSHRDKYIIDINIWYVSIKKRTYNFSGNPETRQILLKGTSFVVFCGQSYKHLFLASFYGWLPYEIRNVALEVPVLRSGPSRSSVG